MKLPLFVLGLSVASAWAGPSVSDVSLSRASGRVPVRVNYVLVGEPAVVTVDFRVCGESLPDASQTNLVGEINRRVGVGSHRFTWVPPSSFAAADADITAVLRAWSTNCPPQLMVVSLTNAAEAVGYYTSTNRLPNPLADGRWRTSHLVMRKIPAANVVWTMGSPDTETGRNAWGYENRRKVMLTRDYYLGVFPVTIAQCRNLNKISGFNSSYLDDLYYLTGKGITPSDDMPRGNLSYGTFRSCGSTDPSENKPIWPASGRENIDPSCLLGLLRVTSGLQFDLPTSAEWEFACRAETFTSYYTDENYLAGVDRLDSLAWYATNSVISGLTVTGPHPVALKRPNGYGLYDLYGNVKEMCLDWFGKLAASESTVIVDPVGPSTYEESKESARPLATGTRIVRGGSCASSAAECRSAARTERYAATYNYTDCGVRLWLPARADR